MGTASFLVCVALVGQNSAPPTSPFDAPPPARQPAVVAPTASNPTAPAAAPNAVSVPPATAPRGDRYDRYRNAPPANTGNTAAPAAPSASTAPPPAMPAERPAPRTWTAPARDTRQPASTTAPPAGYSQPVSPPSAPPAAPPTNAAADSPPPPASEAAAILAETLAPPAEGGLSGQPLTLINVLTLLSDRGQQLRATQAYWNLSAKMADYYLRLREYRLLEELSSSEVLAQGSENDNLSIHAAMARAKADAHSAELAAIAAQHALAALVPLDTRAGLPVASDAPHVGTYRTQFDTIFGARPAPAQAYLTDRLLPIRLEEIRQRAIAVQAATDALDAAIEAWSQSAASPRTVIDSLAALRRQREAFILGVERYNQEIANYALGIAPLGTGSRELTSMLIKLDDVASNARLVPQADAAFSTPGGFAPMESSVAPARFDQPLRNEPTLADPSRRNWNTADAPASAPPVAEAHDDEPALAEPGLLPLSDDPAEQPRPLRPASETSPPATPAGGIEGPQFDMEIPSADEALPPARAPTTAEGPLPTDSIEESEAAPTPAREHSAAREDASRDDALAQLVPVRRLAYYAPDAAVADEGLSTSYHSLLAATPAKRAQRLASLLHWDRTSQSPSETAEPAYLPVTLPELIASIEPGARRPAIDAYWLAREQAARAQAISEEIGQLDVLSPSVLNRRTEATGPLEMLRLRAAKAAAAANLAAARGDLLAAEFQLTMFAGRSPAEAWLRPVTVPHAGGYRLKLEAQPAEIAGSATIRRLAETVPGLHTVFTDRAAAVVMADEARAIAIHDYQLGAGSIDDVLAAIAEETSETEAFLATLTDYNRAIAEYVTTVLPSETPPAKLAGALVLTNTGRSPRDAVERSARGA